MPPSPTGSKTPDGSDRPAEAGGAARPREFPFDRSHFDFIADLVYRLAGIHLPPHKVEMVYARLARRLRELRIADFDAYCRLLESAEGEGEAAAMVNALTTNLTSFFREAHHFDHLAATTLTAVRQAQTGAGRPRLRIWSAGCSSGQEPYTIAMVVHQTLSDLRRWDARILATDIDTQMIAQGQRGVYPWETVGDLPASVRDRFFRRSRQDERERTAMVVDEIRSLVTFKPLNLLEEWPMRGPFDAIFCRNVLIYFDRAGRRRVVDRFVDMLGPQGFLYLGHSENLHGISTRLAPAGATVYRRIP